MDARASIHRISRASSKAGKLDYLLTVTLAGTGAGGTIDVKNYVISINIVVAISHLFESNEQSADSK